MKISRNFRTPQTENAIRLQKTFIEISAPVVHWLDIFGGRFSETLGYGKRDGNSIKLVFEYPDGPFHNTFTWNPADKTWTFLMEQKNKDGKWTTFAEDKLRRP